MENSEGRASEPTEDELAVRFGELCALAGEAREQRLRSIADANPVLASQLRALVAADEWLPSSFAFGAGHTSLEPFVGAAELALGRRLGPYLLQEIIGSGGMGNVWRARADWGGDVALKVLRPEIFGPRARQRFEREATALRRLWHPNLVSFLDMGEQDGIAYLVQELVPSGRTLRELIASEMAGAERPRPVFLEVAELVAQIALGMEEVHRSGVVHRDLKPENILMTNEGRPKVADFGLALLEGESGLTRSGETPGTPRYMSPEQFRESPLCARTDIFSLGAILYELLTLRPLLDGATFLRVREQALRGNFPSPRQFDRRIPIDLATICGQCLEPSPERRYPSMAALAADLRCFGSGQSIEARPPGLLRRGSRRVYQQRTAWSAATGLVLFVLIGSALWGIRKRNASLEWDRAVAALGDAVDDVAARAMGGLTPIVTGGEAVQAVQGDGEPVGDIGTSRESALDELAREFRSVGVELRHSPEETLEALCGSGARDQAFMGLMLMRAELADKDPASAPMETGDFDSDVVLAASPATVAELREQIEHLLQTSFPDPTLKRVWQDWREHWSLESKAESLSPLSEEAPGIAYFWRSRLESERGESAAAALSMVAAVRRDPSFFAAHYALSRSRSSTATRGWREVRIPHAQAAVSLRPNSSRAWYQLGWLTHSLDNELARFAFGQAATLEPTLGQAHANLALLSSGEARARALERAVSVPDPGVMPFRIACSIHPDPQRRIELGLAGLQLEVGSLENWMLRCNLGTAILNLCTDRQEGRAADTPASLIELMERELPNVRGWLAPVIQDCDGDRNPKLLAAAHQIRSRSIHAQVMAGEDVSETLLRSALDSAELAYELLGAHDGVVPSDVVQLRASAHLFLDEYPQTIDALRPHVAVPATREYMRGFQSAARAQLATDPEGLGYLIEAVDELLSATPPELQTD